MRMDAVKNTDRQTDMRLKVLLITNGFNLRSPETLGMLVATAAEFQCGICALDLKVAYTRAC